MHTSSRSRRVSGLDVAEHAFVNVYPTCPCESPKGLWNDLIDAMSRRSTVTIIDELGRVVDVLNDVGAIDIRKLPLSAGAGRRVRKVGAVAV